MNLFFKQSFKFLKNSDFLLLLLVIFAGQFAAALFILSLISSVFSQTQSNFGVSGVILSFAIPSLLMVAFAGLAADILDRRKIMSLTYIGLLGVVAIIIVSRQVVYASIPLSFVYFALNTFSIPASSAAIAQLVKRQDLLIANSLFVFTLAAGIILGLFTSAVIHFFFGPGLALIICEVFLFFALVLTFFLPKLSPISTKSLRINLVLKEIWSTFFYVIQRKKIWFYFMVFALVQAIIAFGITLAPGFFYEVVGINIDKSPIFVFPLIGLGVLAGILFIHKPTIKEGELVTIGFSSLGLSGVILGLIYKSAIFASLIILLVPVGIFLIVVGFGAAIGLIAARTALQKNVPHNFQGTIFAANMILSSLFSAISSPGAATLEIIFGYINLLIFAGSFLILAGFTFFFLGSRW